MVLQPGEMALATLAPATKPASLSQLGEVHPVRRPLLAADQDTAPITLSPLRRQNPRGRARCVSSARRDLRGGGRQRSPLPRPLREHQPRPAQRSFTSPRIRCKKTPSCGAFKALKSIARRREASEASFAVVGLKVSFKNALRPDGGSNANPFQIAGCSTFAGIATADLTRSVNFRPVRLSAKKIGWWPASRVPSCHDRWRSVRIERGERWSISNRQSFDDADVSSSTAFAAASLPCSAASWYQCSACCLFFRMPRLRSHRDPRP